MKVKAYVGNIPCPECGWFMVPSIFDAYHLGQFMTEEEAAVRYNVAARHFFGDHAYLNEVDMG